MSQIPRDAAGNPMLALVNFKKTLLMRFMGVLFLAVVAAVFLEESRDIFYISEDLKDAIKLPFLGQIPSSDRLEKNLEATKDKKSATNDMVAVET